MENAGEVHSITYGGYPFNAGQLGYDYCYSKTPGMPATGDRGFRSLKPLWHIVSRLKWIPVIEKADEAEMDEMWSFVEHKGQQRWLWHAIDHTSGPGLAYVLGSHEDAVFLKLKSLLAPLHITRFYTDDWGAYQRHIPASQHEVGKKNTQKIERKHLTLRTRIKRLTVLLARLFVFLSRYRRMISFLAYLSIDMHLAYKYSINNNNFGTLPNKIQLRSNTQLINVLHASQRGQNREG